MPQDMSHQISMVTGANSGIGKEVALELARRRATVILVCRNRERGESTRTELVTTTNNERIELLLCDLSSQESIRSLVGQFRARHGSLNILVNNAGLYLAKRRESFDGIELTFATNHLGYFMPTILLWDLLLVGRPARVINVASSAHFGNELDFNDLQNRRRYDGYRVYGESKLANLLFTYELNRRRYDAGVTINAVHPGLVATRLGQNNGGVIGFAMRHIVPRFGRPVAKGAETPVFLATSPDIAGESGKYYFDCVARTSSPQSYDEQAATRLWEASVDLTGLTVPPELARSS